MFSATEPQHFNGQNALFCQEDAVHQNPKTSCHKNGSFLTAAGPHYLINNAKDPH